MTAAASAKLFGNPDPAEFAFTLSGFRLGDTPSSVITGALTCVPSEAVGFLPILQGSLVANPNCSILFIGTDFEIVSRLLKIIASAQVRLYGDPDSALTFTADGFIAGDDESILTGTLIRISGENVGSYAITQGSLAPPAGYAISFIPLIFCINPAPLNVVAPAAVRLYGGADIIPFAFDATGIRLSDTLASALTGALARAPGENVGQYDSLRGSLGGSNCTINFTPGRLTIDLAPLTIDALDVTRL